MINVYQITVPITAEQSVNSIAVTLAAAREDDYPVMINYVIPPVIVSTLKMRLEE